MRRYVRRRPSGESASTPVRSGLWPHSASAFHCTILCCVPSMITDTHCTHYGLAVIASRGRLSREAGWMESPKAHCGSQKSTDEEHGQLGHRVDLLGSVERGVATHGFPCGLFRFWAQLLMYPGRRGRRGGIFAKSNRRRNSKRRRRIGYL